MSDEVQRVVGFPEASPTNAYYIAIYSTNDSRSRNSCETVLVFGEPNGREMPSNEKDFTFSWKHVTLPCPHCMFPHAFKREMWWEGHPLNGGERTKTD